MKRQFITVGLILLLASAVSAQAYEMTIHLATGGTVAFSLDEIQRIEFIDGGTGADDAITPAALHLLQNHPNPFNPSTVIAYELPNTASVTVRIYDLQGGVVSELINEVQAAGQHQTTWDGTDRSGARVASGMYLYAVESGGQFVSRRLTLVK